MTLHFLICCRRVGLHPSAVQDRCLTAEDTYCQASFYPPSLFRMFESDNYMGDLTLHPHIPDGMLFFCLLVCGGGVCVCVCVVSL